eukprot:2547196-Prymnesium_polylepis.1
MRSPTRRAPTSSSRRCRVASKQPVATSARGGRGAGESQRVARSGSSHVTKGAPTSPPLAQDATGDGAGGGALSEPLLLRGKSEWSAKLLEAWW